jgi:glutathione S-transferase
MKLIGMFDSPFVRRVAVSMMLLDIPFEHLDWSVGRDFDRIRQFNPLGRVPTLVLDQGEALVESAAILDALDEMAGPARALLPAHGTERRSALRILSMATGAAEKGVLQVYEGVFRPAEKRHEPWLTRCRTQMHSALAELEAIRSGGAPAGWMSARMTQADITTVCVFDFLSDAFGFPVTRYPALTSLATRCAEMPAFAATRRSFDAPKT